MNVLALIASGAVVLASVPSVLGHGYITDPAATWKDGYAVNGWGSSIDSNMWGAIDNSVYGYGTSATVAFFEAEFNSSGYNSLGQFIETNQVLYSDEIDEQCGYTVYDSSARQTMPSTNLTHTGFTHPGPCEAWCDDTKVLFDYDCQTKYPDIPATMPYDESKCANANRLTIYWIGLHGDPWQVYTDCVWLQGGSGSGEAPSAVGAGASTVGGSGSTSTSTTPTTTTAPSSNSSPSTSTTTTAPSTPTTAASGSSETAGEASTSVDETQTTTATPSTSTTEETTPAPETPSTDTTTTGAKCARRRN